jgi:uncharacterized protein (DUF58 family)
MSIYPTRTAAHLAMAGLVAMAAGIALRVPQVVAWGGAILVGVAFARAVTLVSVMRIRAAGFEMLWTGAPRLVRTTRGSRVVLKAEVRNRDTLAARYDKLRVIASPALDCKVEPLAGEVKATGSVELTVTIRALRAGFHGIHGLALEVRGAPGLFEVPLTFANPFGIEVMPRTVGRALAVPHGGRSRTLATAGRPGAQRGDGTELFELREHVPGDPFRRIAWKASARRGKLVVREFEREERDAVQLILDASVELWSGAIGKAPLDEAIDFTALLASQHLARSDLVGLVIAGAHPLFSLAPDSGRAQLGKIVTALLDRSSTLDADRSGWDEGDMAVQVAEHMRPLDARAIRDLRRGRFDKLAERAARLRSHAPFSRPAPAGRNAIDAELRRYAACFGLFVPPRLEPDRERTASTIVAALGDAAAMKRPRPSVVHVIAPPPPIEGIDALRAAVKRVRAKGIAIRWTAPPLASGLDPTRRFELPDEMRERDRAEERIAAVDPRLFAAIRNAVAARALVATKKGEELLRRMGVKVIRHGAGQSAAPRLAPALSEPVAAQTDKQSA